MTASPSERAARERGWLLLPPEAVPSSWRGRVKLLAMVPLLPEEAQRILEEGSTGPALDADEQRLARLVAWGLKAEAIARELDVSSRTVGRRLARLRERFGVDDNAQLLAFLAERGL